MYILCSCYLNNMQAGTSVDLIHLIFASRFHGGGRATNGIFATFHKTHTPTTAQTLSLEHTVSDVSPVDLFLFFFRIFLKNTHSYGSLFLSARRDGIKNSTQPKKFQANEKFPSLTTKRTANREKNERKIRRPTETLFRLRFCSLSTDTHTTPRAPENSRCFRWNLL